MRLVLDASVAVNILVPGLLQAASRSRLRGAELIAPTLIGTEVLSALARLERAGELSTDEADDAVAAWISLPCEQIATAPLAAHIWALRGRLRVADAHYVALARALDAPLLTADRRLAAAVPDGVAVLLVT